jgi:hypothetical protein
MGGLWRKLGYFIRSQLNCVVVRMMIGIMAFGVEIGGRAGRVEVDAVAPAS